MSQVDLETVADELYALAPGEFTGARDEHAAQARQAGDRALAAEIKKLRRPTQSAWLANLLARERRQQLGELLDMGAALREAQASLSGDELRRLSSQRYQVVSALVQEGRRAGYERDERVSEGVAQELEGTLEAALADPRAAEAVRSGRLTSALSYSGFGEVDLSSVAGTLSTGARSAPAGRAAAKGAKGARAGSSATSGKAAKSTTSAKSAASASGRDKKEDADRAAEERRLREQREAAQQRLAAAQQSADDAGTAAGEASEQADEQQARADDLGTREKDLRAHIGDLEEQLGAAQHEATSLATGLREAKRSASAAGRTAATAARTAERARSRLEQAQADLDSLT